MPSSNFFPSNFIFYPPSVKFSRQKNKSLFPKVSELFFLFLANKDQQKNHSECEHQVDRWLPRMRQLTLNVLITTPADNILIFRFYFSEQIRLDISFELSAWQTIHMKYQVLFSLKNNIKNLECCLLQFRLVLYTVGTDDRL